ncbi:MAG: hypothetical protein ACREN5_15340, partial [Gemmatimonadales bacterium]
MGISDTPRGSYRCEDGTEFLVEWPSASAADHAWRWNEDHHPVPFQPLMAALDAGSKPGGQRAYAEANVAPPPPFREWTVANGFQYIRMSLLSPPEMGEYLARAAALATLHGGPCRVWEAFSLPRVRDACDRLRALPVESPVEEASFLYDYAFQLTQVAGPTVLLPVLMATTGLLTDVFGAEGGPLTHEVTQGGANDTIASDQAIWEMAELARADVAVLGLVKAADAGAIERLPVEHPFRRAFSAYIETYRWRGENWDPASPTVGERPEGVLTLVGRGIGAPSPASTTDRSGGRRSETVARIEAALEGDQARLARFRELAGAFDGYVAVREGRALWQLMATGSLRHALLKKGATLAQRGVIEADDDVFFLLPGEVDSATSGTAADHRALVQRRRADWEYWKAKRPPHHIGAAVPPGPLPFGTAVE